MPKATTRLQGSSQRAEADTDARQGEYTTYAPSGETCPDCNERIKSLEVCRRVELRHALRSPAVRYRHLECPQRQGVSNK